MAKHATATLGLIGTVVGCTRNDDVVTEIRIIDGGGNVDDAGRVDDANSVEDVDAAPPGPTTFTAEGYSRACKEDSDCVAVEVGGCSRCCVFTAIARSEQERASMEDAAFRATCKSLSWCTAVCSAEVKCCDGSCIGRGGASYPSVALTCPSSVATDGG